MYNILISLCCIELTLGIKKQVEYGMLHHITLGVFIYLLTLH